MREIKFRARNANEPIGWLYGYFVIREGACFIINDDGEYLVIAGTECQYTGFKDKGVEIYEGDILQWLNPLKSKAEYEKNPYSQCVVKWNDNRAGFDMAYCRGMEIIGNVHETPELSEARP